MGWVPLPVSCPRCGRKIREHAILLRDGAVRCDRGCMVLLYILPNPTLGVAYIAEVTPDEAVQLRALGLNVEKTLEYLGAAFFQSQ